MCVNMCTAPIRFLQQGHQGPDVLLVQTALACQPNTFSGRFLKPQTKFGIFSKDAADFGILSGSGADIGILSDLGAACAVFPGLADELEVLVDPAGRATVAHPGMAALPYGLWTRRHLVRGILGGFLRPGFPNPALAIVPHGVFCSKTVEAVRAFQQAYGLGITGCVDLPTWQRLFPPCRLRLQITPPPPRSGALLGQSFGKPGSSGGSSAGNGNLPRQTGTSTTAKQGATKAAANQGAPPKPPPPAAEEGDDRVEVSVGYNSDNTMSVEAEFLLAKKKWQALGRELGVKANVDGELHQPLDTKLGRYAVLKGSVEVEDIWQSKNKLFSLDASVEAAYQQPLDKGPKNDNNHVVAVHAVADLNLNLPNLVTKPWLKPLVPKLTLEGTAGPEWTTETGHVDPLKPGAELKAVWSF